MKTTIASLAFITALGAGGVASASPAGGHLGKRFSAIDTNGDQAISLGELTEHVRARWSRADADKNGEVTRDEARAAAQAHMKGKTGKHMTKKDANGDGKITRNEVPRMPEHKFARLDANGDGALTADELAHKGSRKSRKAGRRFAKADADGNGAVSAKELESKVSDRFAKLDANRDKKLTKDEFKRARKEARGKRGEGKHGKHGKHGKSE